MNIREWIKGLPSRLSPRSQKMLINDLIQYKEMELKRLQRIAPGTVVELSSIKGKIRQNKEDLRYLKKALNNLKEVS